MDGASSQLSTTSNALHQRRNADLFTTLRTNLSQQKAMIDSRLLGVWRSVLMLEACVPQLQVVIEALTRSDVRPYRKLDIAPNEQRCRLFYCN